MAHTILLFHSAYGLRPGVLRFADALRARGHAVITPDLYDGEVFSTLEPGIRKRDALGMRELIGRAMAASAAAPTATVYAGFSLGAAAACAAAVRAPRARGLILMHGALEPARFGVTSWPSSLPVSVHCAQADPWVGEAEIQALEAAVKRAGAPFQSWTYPCTGHLFADEDLPDYNAPSAALMTERIAAFLDSIR
jgi:dienelactone hydrolase